MSRIYINSLLGQSLLEIIIAMAIFGIIASALVSLSLGGFRGLIQGGQRAGAEALAQEGMEAVRAIRDRAWNENTIIQTGVRIQATPINQWVFSSGQAQFHTTIGEANILPIDDFDNANLLLAQKVSLPQPGLLISLSFYVTQASGKLRLGIYDATGPSGGPGAKKAETAEFIPVVGWNTANVLTPVTLLAGTYWLAYVPDSNNLHFRRAGSGDLYYYSYAYGPMPATFSTTPIYNADHWSFYATVNTTTIGEIKILPIDDYDNANLLLAQKVSLPQPGLLISLSFYVTVPSGKLRLGIYDATGPSGGPGAKKAETAEFTPVVGWNTANVLTPVTLPAGTYWLAYVPDSNNLHFRRAGSGDLYYYSYPYAALPATFGGETQASSLGDGASVILHEIVPGTSYVTNGAYISNSFATQARAWNTLEWRQTDVSASCPTCRIRLQIQTSTDGASWQSNWCGPGGYCDGNDFYTIPSGTLIPTLHNNHRWIRYRATFEGNGNATPILEEVRINYQQ